MGTTFTWGRENTGPVWGARAYPPGSGQDHLGLGSVSSDHILASLSPGINVLTIHPRYWSFYSFVLDEFWARDLPRSRVAFRDFYRPREAVFSMACHVCDAKEHATLTSNIVGSRMVSALSGNEEFDPNFNYIKEPLGGYSLYYRSVMEAMGILVVARPSNGFLYDALTPSGRALASAYRDAISSTALWRDYLDGELARQIPREVLVEFARKGCLCQLRKAVQQDLPLLQDLFTHSGRPEEARARTLTLRLILDLSRSAQEAAISQSEFRQLIYFRSLGDEIYCPRADLVETARQWRLYQAREYFAYAFNRLFGWVVRRGLQESDDGLIAIPSVKVWEMVDDALNNNNFPAATGLGRVPLRSSTPAAEFAQMLVQQLGVESGVDDAWSRHDSLDENALFEWCSNETDDPETLVAMIALLLIIHRRVGTPGRLADLRADAAIMSEGGSLRIGMTRFFTELNRRLMSGQSLSDIARWLIHDLIIVQHERVATTKLPDDTYRLRRIGDTVQFFPKEAPAGLNDSRFLALSTIAHELGLVSNLRQNQRQLTPSGRRLLERGDSPSGVLDRAAESFAGETQADDAH
jgi:hypothetical protein